MTQKAKILRLLEGGAMFKEDIVKDMNLPIQHLNTLINGLLHEGLVIGMKMEGGKQGYALRRRSHLVCRPWLRPTGMDLVRGIESVTFRNNWGVYL